MVNIGFEAYSLVYYSHSFNILTLTYTLFCAVFVHTLVLGESCFARKDMYTFAPLHCIYFKI